MGLLLLRPKKVKDKVQVDVQAFVRIGTNPCLLYTSSVANIYFNAISGTGNTQAALILEMGTLVFYALYILWIGMVVLSLIHI